MLSLTRVSLLKKCKNANNRQSWKEFVEIYTPIIRSVIRKYQVDPNDIDDIMQEVLLQMSKSLKGFEKDPDKGKFRSYLCQVTASKVKDYWRKRKKQIHSIDNLSLIADEVTSDFDGEEHQRKILRTALKQVELKSNKVTWYCFQEHILKKRSAESVACECSITVNSVYINSCRILARVRKTSLNLRQERDCEIN